MMTYVAAALKKLDAAMALSANRAAMTWTSATSMVTRSVITARSAPSRATATARMFKSQSADTHVWGIAGRFPYDRSGGSELMSVCEIPAQAGSIPLQKHRRLFHSTEIYNRRSKFPEAEKSQSVRKLLLSN